MPGTIRHAINESKLAGWGEDIVMLRIQLCNLVVVLVLTFLTQIASGEAVYGRITVDINSAVIVISPDQEQVVFALSFGKGQPGPYTPLTSFEVKQVGRDIYHVRNKAWNNIFWEIDANEKTAFCVRRGSFGDRSRTKIPIGQVTVTHFTPDYNPSQPSSAPPWIRLELKKALLKYEQDGNTCTIVVDGDEVISHTDWEIKRVGIGNFHFRFKKAQDYLPFFQIDAINMKAFAVAGTFGSPDVNGSLLAWGVHSAIANALDQSSGSQGKTGWQQVEMNNMALKHMSEFKGAPGYNIVQQVSTHDYTALEKWFENALDLYKKDAQYESVLQQGFDNFADKKFFLPSDMDLWVEKTGSYIAYAARGIFKIPDGYIARDGTYVSGVPAEKLVAQQQRYNDAAKDLETAISKNPSLTPAYAWLVRIAAASKMPFTAKQMLQKAVENDKRTLQVRHEYIASLQPKWGGSYEAMSGFARQEMTYASVNPLLWTLQGEADAFRAEDHFRGGEYSAAIASYSAALKFGDRIEWLKQRAGCYEKTGQKDKALADYERIRYYNPNDKSLVGRFARPDISSFNYDLKESTYMDPQMSKDRVQAYVVLPVEHHIQWLNERSHEGQGVAKRNSDKLELMLLRLGYDCIERAKLDAILNEQKLSLTGLTKERAQYVGKLVSADAVVIAEIPAMGVHHPLRTCYEDIDIKAVSVSTGKILWKSLLKGSVVSETESVDYRVVLDALETKLYELLEAKMNKEMKRE